MGGPAARGSARKAVTSAAASGSQTAVTRRNRSARRHVGFAPATRGDEGLLTARRPGVGERAPLGEAGLVAIYAGLDSRVNATRAAARAALRKAGLKYQIVTYPGVDHAFFNPTGSRHDPTAAAAAYKRMLGWFGTYLAR